MSTKVCFRCGEEKPMEDFYRHPQTSDGHLNKCKACARADVRRNRKERAFYYKDYDRKRATREDRVEARAAYASSDRGKAVRRAALAKSRAANADKVNARAALRSAVVSGTVARGPCEICGVTHGVHGHHDDYSKPLDVVWLCPKHHSWIHK